ncbi:unnamed protein product [Clonostachys chloroleuca]|uniref:Uncharacterized protein n=1 Tax=Clonostachys chloroleuca TaxID=1926264 RepID=A0AA35M9A6_9HYPO|nr:unnamed protein product [Clonostachys chloroleuca]
MQTYLCSSDDPISALLLRAESIVWFPRIPRVTENQHLPTVNNVAISNQHPLPAADVDNDLRSVGAWSDGAEANIRAAEAVATRAARYAIQSSHSSIGSFLTDSTSFPVVSAESPTTVERPIPPEECFFNETST